MVVQGLQAWATLSTWASYSSLRKSGTRFDELAAVLRAELLSVLLPLNKKQWLTLLASVLWLM